MNTDPGFDQHNNPILYDVRAFNCPGGILAAPLGAELLKGNGRRLTVTADLPLDPDYVRERDYLTEMKARAAKARAARRAEK